MHTYHSTDTNINETIRIWQVLNHYSIQHRKQIYYFVGNITPLLERRNFDYQHMIFPRISNLFYVSYFREKSLIYDLRVSENSTYVTRSIKPRMYVHGILTPPDNLQMQLHVGSPKNWQDLDSIIPLSVIFVLRLLELMTSIWLHQATTNTSLPYYCILQYVVIIMNP